VEHVGQRQQVGVDRSENKGAHAAGKPGVAALQDVLDEVKDEQDGVADYPRN